LKTLYLDEFGFAPRDRLVGEANLVAFAAVERLDDDFEQAFMGAMMSGMAPVFRR